MAANIGKPQADSEGNERIPPDGFDMAAPENYCPRANVGIAPYILKRVFCKTENIGKRFHQKPSTWAAFVVAKFFSKSEIF
ncbi:hypothetical protein [Ruminococcus callidus]|uniref:hypothetical protein n=2 Tax=Oscillospiraceae TaxID=216572 RepID=UPI002E77F473|nr:hypothetical protein [Ruminococcus callidus]MEE0506805.1 hypothetical protein [Ruminococcus callidus]